MPRKLIKRYLPDHHKIRDHKHLRVFGTLLHEPNLWHLNRYSVTGAVTIGLFVGYIPVPFQMVIAAAIAIAARVNLPLSAAMVWVTNPVTMPPMYYFAYKTGTWLLDTPERPFHFELSFQWLLGELGAIWQPFLLGCFVLGILSAGVGNLLVRGLWRLRIARYVKRRKREAQGRDQETGNGIDNNHV